MKRQLCGELVWHRTARQIAHKPAKNPFLTPVNPAPIGIEIALTKFGAHQNGGGWWRAKFDCTAITPFGRCRAEPSERRALYDRLGTGTYLTVISLLSLGIWAGIWAAVASLASAALR